jgi:protein-tyrosine phosphatase
MGCAKRLPLENILNCRDLGGYPCENGFTEYGRFLRCGIPETPTENDIVEVLKHGVTTVIDLRDEDEAERIPSVFKFIDEVDYHNICLLEFNAAISEMYHQSLEKSYEYSLENYKDNYKKALETIADAKEGCVLYHCFFGKDRTGMLTMLLLHIAGVCVEDIIADFQTTYTYILPFIKKKKSDGVVWDENAESFKSTPDSIAYVINYLNTKYGSIDGYLKDIGITNETVIKIKNKFF